MLSTKGDVRLERSLSAAIRAVGSRGFQPSLARFLEECSSFDNLVIIAYRGEDPPLVLYREFTDPVVFELMDSDYVTAGYLLDPFYQTHLDRIPAGLWRMSDIAPDQFKRTAYYRKYYAKTTLIDEIAAVAYVRSGYTVHVCLGRDRSSGKPFSKRTLSVLHRFEQPVVALMEAHWASVQLGVSDQREDSITAVERLRTVLEQETAIRITKRQAEVAIMILRGHSSDSIGQHLGISPQTVKVFRRQLYHRCTICSQAELFALMMPLISLPIER